MAVALDLDIENTPGSGPASDDRRRSRRSAERLLERGDVLAAVERVLSGEHRFVSRALLVQGGPGEGKSAVLHGARMRALHYGWTVAFAECRPIDTPTPFATAASLFGARFDAVADSDPDVVRRRLTGVVESISTTGVLLLVDEARLADEQTWEWFLDLAAQPPAVPFAMVLSSEARLPGASASAVESLAAHSTTQVFALSGLSESAIADLVREHAGAISADLRLAPAIAGATHGNPFLVHRALTALQQFRGGVEEAVRGGRWQLPSASVASWTLSRIRDLPADALSLMRAVAVLGDSADLRSVEAVASAFGGVSDLGAVVDQLIQRQVLQRTSTLSFAHPLVALSIYDEIPSSARSTAHLLAAQQLRLRQRPESDVAAHLLHTEPNDEESTVDACIEGARRVLDKDDDVHMAERFLARAIAEPPSRCQLSVVHALSAEIASRSDSGNPLEILRAALTSGADVPVVFRSGLAVIDRRWGHSDTADIARLLSSVAQDDALAAADRLQLALVEAMLDGRPDAGLALLALVQGAQDTLHRVIGVTGHVLAAGRAATTRLDALATAVQAAVPVAPLVRSPMLEQAFQQLVTILIGVGDLEAAGALLDLASQVEGLSDTARRWHAVLRADLHMAGGHLIAAERELSLLLGARGVDGTLLAETATAKLALVMHLRGNPSGVLGVGNTSVRVLRPGTGWCQQLRAVEAEGALRCRQGDWKAARARFRVSRGLASSAHVDSPAVTQWRVGMARALHGSGELELARHHAEDDLAVATALGAPRPLASALRAMALTSDQPDAKVAMLEHACTLLEDRPLLFDQCETLLELGVAYRGTGREDDSLDALRGAADLAVRMGAGALMSSTHHELLASGARPRRLALSGVSALTPAERKVAAMAASGRKNTEIAGDLYVSIKTVESHLARVYRKLQIDGRVALAERWLQLTAFGDAR